MFIHTIAFISITFFYGWMIFILCIHNNLFIHSFFEGHLGCFYLLAYVNSATISMCIYTWVLIFNSFWYITGVELLGHRVILCITFWETTSLSSTAATTFYITTRNVQVFQYFHIHTLRLDFNWCFQGKAREAVNWDF